MRRGAALLMRARSKMLKIIFIIDTFHAIHDDNAHPPCPHYIILSAIKHDDFFRRITTQYSSANKT